MTKIKTTGQTCIGDLRLSALDVGFDLRADVGKVVRLPAEFQSVGLDDAGETWLITGTRAEMVQAIRSAGYVIAADDDRCDHPGLDEDGACIECGDCCSHADVGAEEDGVCHDPECPIHGWE